MSKELTVQQQKVATIRDMFEKTKDQFRNALPQHVKVDRMMRIALTCIRLNPKLLDCVPESLIACVMKSAQLGLEPDNILGQAYLIPYGKEAQFVPGYKGLRILAYNSGEISSIDATLVYENDEFEYQRGLEPKLHHKPALKDRGEIIAVYAMARFRGKKREPQWEVMPIEDVWKIRDRYSQSYKTDKKYNKGDSPWNTAPKAMIKKTVLRQLCNQLPLSPEKARELHQAVAYDERHEARLEQGITGEFFSDYQSTITARVEPEKVDPTAAARRAKRFWEMLELGEGVPPEKLDAIQDRLNDMEKMQRKSVEEVMSDLLAVFEADPGEVQKFLASIPQKSEPEPQEEPDEDAAFRDEALKKIGDAKTPVGLNAWIQDHADAIASNEYNKDISAAIQKKREEFEKGKKK